MRSNVVDSHYSITSLVALTAIGIATYNPQVWVPVLFFNFIYGIGIYGMRLAYLPKASSFKKEKRAQGTIKEHFFSIHIPICCEPPEVTIKTLQCLLQIDYKKFEVIVLSNNTKDGNLWKPVEAFCQKYDMFRFYHYEKLSGYKAGALNKALKLTSPKADVILTIDSDYCVNSNILHQAIIHLDGNDYIQFPQAYRNCTREGYLLNEDFAHFFKIYMQEADKISALLLTGTLTFIRKEVLQNIGGWSHFSITEDAQTGLLLLDCGHKGSYIHQVVGRGLIPDDIVTLRKQRQRWAFGNAEVLKYFLTTTFPEMSLRKKISILLQLTAWHDYLLIPTIALMSISLSLAIWPLSDELPLTLSLISFISFMLMKFIFIWIKFPNLSIAKTSHLFLLHQALFLEANLSWLLAFIGKSLKFKRTNKFSVLKNNYLVLPLLMVCGMLMVTTLLYLWKHEEIAASVSTLGFLILGASQYYIYKTFKPAKLNTIVRSNP